MGSHARVSWSRIGRGALLALQLAVGFAPLIERWEPGRPVAHADEQGSRHLFPHDESNCALCAVRTIVAEAPAEPELLPDAEEEQGTVVTAPRRLLSSESAATHPPRAPPVLG